MVSGRYGKCIYNAVTSGQLSILGASRQFNVPRTTLSERVQGKAPLQCKPGAKTALTMQDEDALVGYIHYIAARGYPVTCDQVIGLARGIASQSSQHVVVPSKSKYAHILALGSSEHITMVGCISAGGTAIRPLIVFSGGLPCLRALEKDGPSNATYAATKSGFVDQGLYLDWFEKDFLRYAPAERPLVLLQDGASADISAKLIDCAIQNNVILICFPPHTTFVL